jgi:hypothetical protein
MYNIHVFLKANPDSVFFEGQNEGGLRIGFKQDS